MPKTLVLAEKPSVAREIARVIGARKNSTGFIEGDKYIVTWALGHLVSLAEPEKYGEEYKKWSFETLPMLPEKMKLEVIKETSKQFSSVKQLLLSNSVSDIIIATDAGREGELVARWIIEKAGCKKPIRRLWISSQTDKAIREGFASLHDGSEYIPLCNAAKARAEADWLVGLNVTRALTCRHNAQLSAGRVQTPTLAIIAERENEIKNFRPKDYFNLHANFGSFRAIYRNSDGVSAIQDRITAEKLAQKISGKDFTVKDVKATQKKIPAPMLYDLTELQRDANKLFKMSPKETLSVMQRLYENHKVLTYPRTDSRYITDDIVPTLYDRVKAASIGTLSETGKDIIRSRKSINKLCVNASKVSDHHAIIPTEETPDVYAMSNEEKKIYVLVVSRFFSCFYPDFIYKQIKAELECAGESFFVSGKEIIDSGWKKLGITDSDDEEEKDEAESGSSLPPLAKGTKIKCIGYEIKPMKTSPPSRYTEASLLSAMENPSKFIKDRKMKEYIGGGLGTPATRADIIEKLYSAFYIEKKDNVIYPTSKGMQLIDIVPSELKEPLLTAKWEMELEKIAKGQMKKENFLSGIRSYASELVKTVKSSQATYKHDNMTRTPCPQCGKMLLKVTGKRGEMLICQDRECGYRESLSVKTGARCPNCHKALEMRGHGDSKILVCKCGFKQKAEVFFKAKDDAGASASKQFVRNFMQNQEKNVPKTESPLALALKKAMEQNKSQNN